MCVGECVLYVCVYVDMRVCVCVCAPTFAGPCRHVKAAALRPRGQSGDSVVSALLPLYRFNPPFVGATMTGPSLSAEPGLLAGPFARGSFKRVEARARFHSHARTSPGHQSEVSSHYPLSKPDCPHSPTVLSPPPSYTHTHQGPQILEGLESMG